MTRIKLLTISTITAVMILGSTLVFAAGPAADSGVATSADQVSATTDISAADPGPARRGGGGSGRSLRK